MKQIKIFTSALDYEVQRLQDNVNEWIKEKSIEVIQIESHINSGSGPDKYDSDALLVVVVTYKL